MDRHDRFRARRDCRDGLRRIDVERRRVDVDEHRLCADARDAAGGGEERVGGRDDFVAGADAERHQRQQQRVGTGRHRDRVADAELRGELALERVHLGPHDEALAVADARDRGENLVAQRPVLRLEIEQRNGHRVVIVAAAARRYISGAISPPRGFRDRLRGA